MPGRPERRPARSTPLLAAPLIAALLLCTWSSAPAQESSKPIRVDVGLVLVNVSLLDSNHQPVAGVVPEDLELYEDGARQQIAYFGRDELPLNLALMLDVSGSIVPILPQVKSAAERALGTLRPEDAVALFAFTRRVRRLVDFTTDREPIVERIADLTAGGGTALIDALYHSARSLSQLPRDRRRVIAMISDNQGMPGNEFSESEAIKEAQEAGAVFFGIQISGPRDRLQWVLPGGVLSRRVAKAMRQTGDMKRFAEQTGGSVIASGKAGGVAGAFRELMLRLSAQLYVGYFSSNTRRDGTLRSIEVKLSRAGRSRLGNVQVLHRRAYVAPRGP